MKVSLKHRQHKYSGDCDDLVYYIRRGCNQLIARRYVRPRYSESNRALGTSGKHLKSLRPSLGYIQDLRLYIQLFNARLDQNQPPLNNWYAVFVHLMFAQAKALGIPITSLTLEIIDSQNLPVRTVKSAIEAGLLDMVDGYERMENMIS